MGRPAVGSHGLPRAPPPTRPSCPHARPRPVRSQVAPANAIMIASYEWGKRYLHDLLSHDVAHRGAAWPAGAASGAARRASTAFSAATPPPARLLTRDEQRESPLLESDGDVSHAPLRGGGHCPVARQMASSLSSR